MKHSEKEQTLVRLWNKLPPGLQEDFIKQLEEELEDRLISPQITYKGFVYNYETYGTEI